MNENTEVNSAKIAVAMADSGKLFACSGDWTREGITALTQRFSEFLKQHNIEITIDGKAIPRLDSAGAWFLKKLQMKLMEQDCKIHFIHFKEEQKKLLDIIEKHVDEILLPEKPKPAPGLLYKIGALAVRKVTNGYSLLNFIGKFSETILHILQKPRRFIFSSFINAIDEAGYQALPIIAMMSFLVGVVLAYQLGIQLKPYGANIFIVNITGMAILREFAPLITAIIASGRTTSAFTAQIGMMKVKEEIDALRCLGLSPIERLVVPKVFGTMIAVPFLTVWASIFGMLGSMVMSEHMLGITFNDFILRFDEVIKLNDYLVGMYKAPVFALIVSAVGCYQGFRVTMTAESVGWQTTKSVVQSIFFIICADAGFSVLFNWANI